MSAPDLPIERLPVSLLTGFLGSGKTTLLKHLLGHPGLADTAVIINEFGDVGLDHRLVESTTDQTVLLDSGCLCCTIRGDLIDTLRSLFKRRAKGEIPAFRRVVIESTGLADPAPILHTLMSDPLIADRFRLDGVIATIDAVNGMEQLDRQPESVKQAAVADRLVLTKTDLAAPERAAALKQRLGRLNPAAPLLEAVRGAVDPARLLDAGLFRPEAKSPDVRAWLRAEAYAAEPAGGDHHGHDHHGHDHDAHARGGHEPGHRHDQVPTAAGGLDRNRHDDHIRAFAITHDRPLDWPAFADWIERLIAEHGDKLLRIKGILDVAGHDQPIAIHGVQHLFHPPASLPAWNPGERRSALVFILRDLEESVIRQGFAAMLARAPTGR
jgi:G3E family GTPase